jgi:hypothetical protein
MVNSSFSYRYIHESGRRIYQNEFNEGNITFHNKFDQRSPKTNNNNNNQNKEGKQQDLSRKKKTLNTVRDKQLPSPLNIALMAPETIAHLR